MIDALTANDSLNVNTGEGVQPSPPPSSSGVTSGEAKVNSTSTETGVPQTQQSAEAVQVELTPEAREGLEATDQANQQSDREFDEELRDTIDRLNLKLNKLDREILLKIDQRIGKNYVSVVEKDSQEVIREFPPKEVRSFIARFMEFNENLASETDLKSLIINLEV